MQRFLLLFTIVALSVSAAYAGQEQDSASQVFYREGSQKSFKGPDEQYAHH